MNCQHDYIISEGKIKCRLCDKEIVRLTKSLAVCQSLKQARRILDELAIANKYVADRWESNSVIYSRIEDRIRHELRIIQGGKRKWTIVKSSEIKSDMKITDIFEK